MNKREFEKRLNECLLETDKILLIESDNDGWCKPIVYDGDVISLYTAKDKNVIYRALVRQKHWLDINYIILMMMVI